MSNTPKYSLIGAGQGRCGSVWLQTALAHNSADPTAQITHELFRVKLCEGGLAVWQHPTGSVIIDTNTSLETLAMLIDMFGAQVGVVLREPVAWIQSLVARRLKKARGHGSDFDEKAWRCSIQQTAAETFERTDTMLTIIEQHGQPLVCWHLDYCVTVAGIREIAAWAGLPLRSSIQLPGRINVTQTRWRLAIQKLCPDAKQVINAAIRQFPRVCAAYSRVGVSTT